MKKIAERQNFLTPDIFETVISATPLVSVDLIIENSENQFLMGLRRNRPAQGIWFVPGGRIMKNEKIKDAVFRVISTEIGSGFQIEKIEQIGAFDHIYGDSIFPTDSEIGTHYVAIGFHIKIDNYPIIGPGDDQHAKLRWFDATEILENETVHNYSQNYIRKLVELTTETS